MSNFIAATKALSRVFVAEGLPGPSNAPTFQSCLVMGGASQAIGGVTYIYCPDPENYNQFIVVGEIQEREEQVETSLSGHFPLTSRSQILKWAKAKSPLAIHVHFGQSTNPQNFNHFTKAVIFDEGAKITSTDIDEMGALQESGEIGQSCDISAASFYEVVPLTYVAIQPDLITTGGVDAWLEPVYNEYLAVDKRFAMYVVTNGDGAATPGKLIYSLDGGENFGSVSLTGIGGANAPSGVAAVNEVVVVISADTGDMYYIDLHAGDTALTTVTVTQAMNAIDSAGATAYVVGDTGYMGRITDYTQAPEEITPGSGGNLVSVSAHLSGAVAAGDDAGYVFFSADGTTFGAVEVEAGQSITAVEVVSADIAWAGSDTGKLYYTQNAGQDWDEASFPGSGTGVVTDINFPTLSVGYITHEPATGDAKLIKTVGAGAPGTWYRVPYTGSIPVAKRYKLALMRGEPNVLLAAGPATATVTGDGTIMYGAE